MSLELDPDGEKPFDTFIEKELSEKPVESEIQTPSPSQPAGVSEGFLSGMRQAEAAPTGRHSIKTCPCAKCQARRIALARQFGIVAADTDDEYDDAIFDAETIGKIFTSYHTYRFVSIKTTNPNVAEAWKVSSESQEAYGKMGEKLLRKYLGRMDFQYKQELILGLFLTSDLSIRFLHERKLALIEGEKK